MVRTRWRAADPVRNHTRSEEAACFRHRTQAQREPELVGRRRCRNLADHRDLGDDRLGDLAGLDPKRLPGVTQLEAIYIFLLD